MESKFTHEFVKALRSKKPITARDIDRLYRLFEKQVRHRIRQEARR